MLATAFLLIAFSNPAAQGQSALSARQIVLSTGDVVFVGPGTDARIVLRREADLRIAATPDGREAVVLVDEQQGTLAPDGLVDRAYRFELAEALPPQYLYRGIATVEEVHAIEDGRMRRGPKATFVTPVSRLRFGHDLSAVPSEDVVIRTRSMNSTELSFDYVGDRRFDSVEYMWINHLEGSHGGPRASVRLAATTGPPLSRSSSRIVMMQTQPKDVTPPEVLDRAPLSSTGGAMRRGIEGCVLLEVTVLPDGRAGEIKVIRSLDPDLDRAAVASVAKWRFRPGMRNGQPVGAPVGIENCFSFGPAR